MTLYLDNEVDLLAIQGGRQLLVTPWHFVSIHMPTDASISEAKKWIWRNLSGRYSLTSITNEDYETHWIASFEDESEASAFTLSMPLMMETYF